MFSAIKDGSIIHILNKREKLTYNVGRVISVKNSQFNNNFYQNGQYFNGEIDISVDVNGKQIDFGKVPSSQNIAYYDNGNTIISENSENIINEVRNAIQISDSVLNTIDYHKSVKVDGEDILKKLDPRFAKEKDRDEEINNLSKRMDNVDVTLKQIVSLLSKPENK